MFQAALRVTTLGAALDQCKRLKATLLIAKLDRLARNVHFVSGLLEAKVDFLAADMPSADHTMILIYSVVAEFEARAISTRTKAALAQAKARGVILGRAGPSNLRGPYLDARREGRRAFAERLLGNSTLTGHGASLSGRWRQN